MVSIIIPIYNEEKILIKDSLYFKRLGLKAELIFCDGGSSDRTAEIAVRFGRLIQSEKGRGLQMNSAVRLASHSTLLFLHADTKVLDNTLVNIEKATQNYGCIAGCLRQKIGKEGAIYRLIENFGNLRAKITKVFYGDQGIFVNKDIFLKLGGFPEVPVMEDILFTKKLRRYGKTAVLSDTIFVSGRRWEKKGIIKTVFLYSFLNILFWLGSPLGKLKRLYVDLR